MRHSCTYRAFGLVISANRTLPWLDEGSGDPALHLSLAPEGVAPPPLSMPSALLYRSTQTNSEGIASFEVWHSPEGFRFRYRDGTEIRLDEDGANISAFTPAGATVADTCCYMFGPVMGWVLRLRGGVPLHASAVCLSGRAVLLVGTGGAGKSTAAASFVLAGAPLISDDITPLVERNDRLHAQPAYPHIRLWPDSVTALFGSPEHLPRVTPNWEKRGLAVRAHGLHFEERPREIAAVYVIEGAVRTPAPVVAPLRGHRALIAMIGNTYVSYLATPSMKRREMDVLERLVATTPVRAVRADGVDHLRSAICADLAALPAPSAHV